MKWLDDKVLASGGDFGLVLMNPQGTSKTWVVSFGGRPRTPQGCQAPPLFGFSEVYAPMVFDGDRFFSSSAQSNALYLHRQGKPRALLLYLPDGRRPVYKHLMRTPYGILLITWDREVYPLRRKAD